MVEMFMSYEDDVGFIAGFDLVWIYVDGLPVLDLETVVAQPAYLQTLVLEQTCQSPEDSHPVSALRNKPSVGDRTLRSDAFSGSLGARICISEHKVVLTVQEDEHVGECEVGGRNAVRCHYRERRRPHNGC